MRTLVRAGWSYCAEEKIGGNGKSGDPAGVSGENPGVGLWVGRLVGWAENVYQDCAELNLNRPNHNKGTFPH